MEFHLQGPMRKNALYLHQPRSGSMKDSTMVVSHGLQVTTEQIYGLNEKMKLDQIFSNYATWSQRLTSFTHTPVAITGHNDLATPFEVFSSRYHGRTMDSMNTPSHR